MNNSVISTCITAIENALVGLKGKAEYVPPTEQECGYYKLHFDTTRYQDEIEEKLTDLYKDYQLQLEGDSDIGFTLNDYNDTLNK